MAIETLVTPLVYSFNRKGVLEMYKFFWEKNAKFPGKTYVATDEPPTVENNNFVYVITQPRELVYHFRPIMLAALEQIKTEFILFTIEDMFFKHANWEKVEPIVQYMKKYDVDSYSFTEHPFHLLEPLGHEEIELGITNDKFGLLPQTWLHRHSLHPSIWNRQALIDVFVNNPLIETWQLDQNLFAKIRPLIAMGTKVSNLEVTVSSSFDINECQISFLETIRHGLFWSTIPPWTGGIDLTITDSIKQFFIEYGANLDDPLLKPYLADSHHKGLYY